MPTDRLVADEEGAKAVAGEVAVAFGIRIVLLSDVLKARLKMWVGQARGLPGEGSPAAKTCTRGTTTTDTTALDAGSSLFGAFNVDSHHLESLVLCQPLNHSPTILRQHPLIRI